MKNYLVLLALVSAQLRGMYTAYPIGGGSPCALEHRIRLVSQKERDLFITQCEALGYDTVYQSKRYKSEKTARKKCKKNHRCKAIATQDETPRGEVPWSYLLCRGSCD